MKFKTPRLRAPRARTALILLWAKAVFFAAGFLALCYCASVILDRWIFQAYQTRQFERALKDAHSSPQPLQWPALPSLLVDASRAHAESLGIDGRAGFPLGRIEIRSIGLTAMVMEGDDDRTLRRAVGHIPGTPLPGQPGNVALTGHRDTFFRGLRNIHKDDEITLTTLRGAYRYRVDSTQVVEPDDTQVLSATAHDFLTLVTCYPFYFVGSAPKRFIVRAHRITN